MKQKIIKLLNDEDAVTYASSIFLLGAVLLCGLVILFL